MSLVVSPSLTFRTDVQLVQMPAKQARGLVSSSANQMSPPSPLLNSLNELNGTTQRFSTPSQRVQCLLFALRMLVVPPSGSILSNSLKSTGFSRKARLRPPQAERPARHHTADGAGVRGKPAGRQVSWNWARDQRQDEFARFAYWPRHAQSVARIH